MKPLPRFAVAPGPFFRRFLLFLSCFVFFLCSPLAPFLCSLGVMQIYSRQNEKESLLATEEIRLEIPGGLTTLRSDWYPFVMNFCDGGGFRSFTGNSRLSLTILYNFAAFSPWHGCSRLYDCSSPYYNSFYGAYLVKDSDNIPYGFRLQEGNLTPVLEEIAAIPQYDFFYLVLSEFGVTRENQVFQWNVTEIEQGLSYANHSNFVRMDALVTVNGSAHSYLGFTPSYLQYGTPGYKTEEPLAPVTMYGRLYGTYLEEKHVSLFFYIVTADLDVLEQCDRTILSKSTLVY